jgi:hypothetical protein
LLFGVVLPNTQKVSIFQLNGSLGRVYEKEHNAHEEEQSLYQTNVKQD